MATLFIDSSALIKYYYTERGSAWTRRVVNDKSSINVISLIAVAEVSAALSQIRRRTSLGETRMQEMYAWFRGDLRQGHFLARTLDEAVLNLAADLALRLVLKAYDAVQIAAAALVREKLADPDLIFVSGDHQVLRAAKLEGFLVEDPEAHADEDPSPREP